MQLGAYDEEGHVRPIDDILDDVICEAFIRYDSNISEIARRLRIGRLTIYRAMVRFGWIDCFPSLEEEKLDRK